MVDDVDLYNRFSVELKALENRPFIFETDAVTAWSIMRQLQLALRHPENTGPTADLARNTACKIIDVLAPLGTALRQVAEMGWDKKYDS